MRGGNTPTYIEKENMKRRKKKQQKNVLKDGVRPYGSWQKDDDDNLKQYNQE